MTSHYNDLQSYHSSWFTNFIFFAFFHLEILILIELDLNAFILSMSYSFSFKPTPFQLNLSFKQTPFLYFHRSFNHSFIHEVITSLIHYFFYSFIQWQDFLTFYHKIHSYFLSYFLCIFFHSFLIYNWWEHFTLACCLLHSFCLFIIHHYNLLSTFLTLKWFSYNMPSSHQNHTITVNEMAFSFFTVARSYWKHNNRSLDQKVKITINL